VCCEFGVWPQIQGVLMFGPPVKVSSSYAFLVLTLNNIYTYMEGIYLLLDLNPFFLDIFLSTNNPLAIFPRKNLFTLPPCYSTLLPFQKAREIGSKLSAFWVNWWCEIQFTSLNFSLRYVFNVAKYEMFVELTSRSFWICIWFCIFNRVLSWVDWNRCNTWLHFAFVIVVVVDELKYCVFVLWGFECPILDFCFVASTGIVKLWWKRFCSSQSMLKLSSE